MELFAIICIAVVLWISFLSTIAAKLTMTRGGEEMAVNYDDLQAKSDQ